MRITNIPQQPPADLTVDEKIFATVAVLMFVIPLVIVLATAADVPGTIEYWLQKSQHEETEVLRAIARCSRKGEGITLIDILDETHLSIDKVKRIVTLTR